MTWFEGDMWSSIIHSVYDGNKCDLSYRRNNKNEEHTLPQKQLHVVAEEYGTRTGTWSHVLKTEFCISNLPFVENVTFSIGGWACVGRMHTVVQSSSRGSFPLSTGWAPLQSAVRWHLSPHSPIPFQTHFCIYHSTYKYKMKHEPTMLLSVTEENLFLPCVLSKDSLFYGIRKNNNIIWKRWTEFFRIVSGNG
jgi:hypothetical protein